MLINDYAAHGSHDYGPGSNDDDRCGPDNDRGRTANDYRCGPDNDGGRTANDYRSRPNDYRRPNDQCRANDYLRLRRYGCKAENGHNCG
jgi:hypothetical protein